MKRILLGSGALAAGSVLLGIGYAANHFNAKINIPRPSFTEEGLPWGGSPVLNQDWLADEKSDLVSFHMEHASKRERPEFCLSTPLEDTFLDYVARDKCYFRESASVGDVTYSVTDCIFDSEWVEMQREKPVECTKVVTIEKIDEFKAGKASRYYGDKPLLAAEKEISDIKSTLGYTSLLGGLLGFLVFCMGGFSLLLSILKSKKKKQ